MTPTGRLTMAMAMLFSALAAPAAAQYSAPSMSTAGSVGEDYHIQAAAGLWAPTLTGVVSSEQLGIVGTKIDFVKDLKFQDTKFSDFRFEIKAGKRNKLYAQYVPITYSSDTTLTRDIVFNGQKFSANLPIQSQFNWKVWRVGYELDLVSTDRFFLGALAEARITDFSVTLKAPGDTEFTSASGPLPAYGGIARAYLLPNMSVTASVSGFKLWDSLAQKLDATGNYVDMDFYATYNINRYLGVQGGYRKMTLTVTLKKDFGDMEYAGVWFGGVIRY